MACSVTGGGATLVLAPIDYTGRIVSMTEQTDTVALIDDSDLNSTAVKQCPGDLIDYGGFDAVFAYDAEGKADYLAILTKAEVTATVIASDTSQRTGLAIISGRTWGPFVVNEKIVVTYSFTWVGGDAPPLFTAPP